MEDTQQTPTGTLTSGEANTSKTQGITSDNDYASARSSLALAVLGTETITNQKAVLDRADEIMDLLQHQYGAPSVTTLAALFSIAMTHAPEFRSEEMLAVAEKFKQ